MGLRSVVVLLIALACDGESGNHSATNGDGAGGSQATGGDGTGGTSGTGLGGAAGSNVTTGGSAGKAGSSNSGAAGLGEAGMGGSAAGAGGSGGTAAGLGGAGGASGGGTTAGGAAGTIAGAGGAGAGGAGAGGAGTGGSSSGAGGGAPTEWSACHYVGGQDRVEIGGLVATPGQSYCVRVIFASPMTAPAGLTLPTNWGLRMALAWTGDAGGCIRPPGSSSIPATSVSGTASWPTGQLPNPVDADLNVEFPSNPGPGPVRIVVDDLDASDSC